MPLLVEGAVLSHGINNCVQEWTKYLPAFRIHHKGMVADLMAVLMTVLQDLSHHGVVAFPLGFGTPEVLVPDEKECLPVPRCRHICPVPVPHEAGLAPRAYQGDDEELSLASLGGVHREDADLSPVVLGGLPGQHLHLGAVARQDRNVLICESGRLNSTDQIGDDGGFREVVLGRAIGCIRARDVDEVLGGRDHVSLLAGRETEGQGRSHP